MNKYCFVSCNSSKIISGWSPHLYPDLRDIPKPLFVKEDIENHPGFLARITKKIRDELFKAKSGSVVLIEENKLYYYWLGIRVGDEDDELFDMISYMEDLKSENKILKQKVKESEIYKEYEDQNKEIKKLNKLIYDKKWNIDKK